jgi:RimJ/RimL family protein N-acetyltransferase
MDLNDVTFASARLVVSAFKPQDAADSLPNVTPTLTRYMSFDPSPSLEAFAAIWSRWLAEMAAGTDLAAAVRLAATGDFLGMTGLHRIANNEAETGIWIKETAHGFGYGREAVSALIAWAARELALRAVIYPVVEENRPSRKLAEALGGMIVGKGRLEKSGGIGYATVIYRIPAGP